VSTPARNEPIASPPLAAALSSGVPSIAERVCKRMHSEIPSYRAIPRAELQRDLSAEVSSVAQAVLDGQRAPSAADLATRAEVGERRARQGIPLHDMLRAWMIGLQEAIAWGQETAARVGATPESASQLVQKTILTWSDVAMASAAEAHRRAELELARQDHDRRARTVRVALDGSLPPAELRSMLAAYGLDPAKKYFTICARPTGGMSLRDIERSLGFLEAAQHRRGLAALADDELIGFTEVRPPESSPGVIGVGPPRHVDELKSSFRVACRVLAAADAFSMSGAHDLNSVGVLPAVLDDDDVGEALVLRYIEPVRTASSSEAILAGVQAWLDAGMHTGRAAAQLFVHPNTLRYRIRRYQELAVVDLTEPAEALKAWWALQRFTATRGGAAQ
jgi:hypothetical protein